jgi:hypothetical protein
MEYLVSIAGQIAESGEEIIKSCWQKNATNSKNY